MRILMVEDDKDLCDAVTKHLNNEGYETDCAHDGEEGLYYLSEGVYDLILLDRMIPHIDGIQLLKRARSRGVTTPVLLLTAMGEIGDRVQGLDAGADDYLTKPFDTRELLARVRALSRRPSQLSDSSELHFGDLMMDTADLYLEGKKGRCTLSKKEAELLASLMKSQGKTLSRSTLFAHAWGPDAEVEEASLDSYAHFIRRRLNAVSKCVKLVTVRGVGYKLEDLTV